MAKAPGMIRRRGAGWNVVIRINGERHEYGPKADAILRSGTRNDVEEWVWREYKSLLEQSGRASAGLPGPMRMSALLDKYEEERLPPAANSRKAYKISIAAFRSFFTSRHKDPHVHRVRRAHIRDFINWRRLHRPDGTPANRTVGSRTIAKDRTVLHSVFGFAEELELRDGNPVAGVKPPKADGRQPVILRPERLDALLAATDRDDHGHLHPERYMLRMFVLLMAETGARSESEVLHLRWPDLDLDGGFVWFASGRDGHRTKSGKGRWTPMTPRLRQALREHVLRFRGAEYDGATSAYVIHHTKTRRNAKAGQRVRSFRRAFNAAVRRAGLPAELNQHDLRHSRITWWLAEGKNPVHVKEAVGHADLRTTMGYTHLAREHLRALVEDGKAAPSAAATGGTPEGAG